jgi:hypothetical protein
MQSVSNQEEHVCLAKRTAFRYIRGKQTLDTPSIHAQAFINTVMACFYSQKEIPSVDCNIVLIWFQTVVALQLTGLWATLERSYLPTSPSTAVVAPFEYPS